MQRVGAEHRIARHRRPGVEQHVEFERRREIGWAFRGDTRRESREVLDTVGRLPRQVRQVPREMHRVLTRAGTDLDHASSVGERLAQHPEDRSAVALAGFGVRQHCGLYISRAGRLRECAKLAGR